MLLSRAHTRYFVAGLCTLGPWVGSPLPTQATTPVIERIDIIGNERTAAKIIRRELLFAEGEVVDSTALTETARNLRRLSYIGEGDIRVLEDGVVAVAVEDLYSRALGPVIAGHIDELTLGVTALDYNLCGRGQSLRIAAQNSAISGLWTDLHFAEPRLGSTRHALTAQIGLGTEGNAHSLALSRPFATLADRRAYGLSLATGKSLRRLYAGGALRHKYSDARDAGRLWLARSYGDTIKLRPSLHLNFSHRRFAPATDYTYAPANRNRITLSTGLLIWRPAYRRDRYIHDLGPLEDMQTGSWIALRWGFAHSALGSNRTFSFYQIHLAPRWEPSRRSYALVTLFANTRLDGRGMYNLYALGSAALYVRVGRSHSAAVRLSWEALHRSEDAAQLLLGLERGLRGFGPRHFDGTRRLRLNIEARPTLYRHGWYTLAAALFIDSGTAWSPASSRAELAHTPGAGLRIGFPKFYNTPLLRGDIAIGGGQVHFSVGMGQYF